MIGKRHITRMIKQSGVLVALAAGLLAATSSPAAAYSKAGSWGAIGAREADVPAYPNKCYSKNFYSGQFTTTQVWVSRTSDPRYAQATQYIGAWLTLKKYNSATKTWNPVSINGSTATFLGWNETSPPPTPNAPVSTLTTARVGLFSVSHLAPGWYTVELQYAWWVPGVGYVGSAKDAFNNDTYRRFLGVSLNSGPDSITTVGACYVD
jgi:hypothetical protein